MTTPKTFFEEASVNIAQTIFANSFSVELVVYVGFSEINVSVIIPNKIQVFSKNVAKFKIFKLTDFNEVVFEYGWVVGLPSTLVE